MKRKKGVSAVVGTVLLIVISVVAVTIIASILIPMIRKNLEEGGKCFELMDQISIIKQSGNVKTCYGSGKVQFIVKRGFKDIELGGFAISISGDGRSDRYDIIEGSTDDDGVYEYGKTDTDAIGILKPGTERTYIIETERPTKIEIAGILESGKLCDIQDRLEEIPNC